LATQTTDTVTIQPACNLRGSLSVPGDKSISHRYAMLAAIAEGRSSFSNFSTGADCASTLSCLRTLGCRVTHGVTVEIEGRGMKLEAPALQLDCGNSGSTMRMLAGILAGQAFESVMIGDASLSKRPMKRVIDPLTQMGANVSSQDGRPPLIINGGNLKGIDYKTPVASAQVKSAILLAALRAHGTTRVTEPAPTRDHTERMLAGFGVRVGRSGATASLEGGQALTATDVRVPAEFRWAGGADSALVLEIESIEAATETLGL